MALMNMASDESFNNKRHNVNAVPLMYVVDTLQACRRYYTASPTHRQRSIESVTYINTYKCDSRPYTKTFGNYHYHNNMVMVIAECLALLDIIFSVYSMPERE